MKNTGSLNLNKEVFGSTINTMSKDMSNFEKVPQNDDSKEPVWKYRYVITLIAFLINLSVSVHRTVMSVVIVAMVNNTAVSRYSTEESESCLHLITNYTEEDTTSHRIKPEGEFIWSPEIQGYILGSFFIGHVIMLMPGSILAERYGCRLITVGTDLIGGILMILTPFFASLSASAMIVIQLLRGAVLAMPLSCVSILIANWSPKTERGFLYSIALTAHFLGPASGNIFAGFVSELPGGWPYVFYTLGVLELLLAISTLLFVAENPTEHTRISKAELNFIMSQQENKLSRRRPKVPWRKLLTSVPVYALICTMFGRFWTVSQFGTVQSTFLGTILHYPIGRNGLFSAMPYFLAFLTSMIVTWISAFLEKKKFASVNFLRKFWTFLSGLAYSLCFIGMYMAGCNRDLSTIFSILSLASSGLGLPGTLPVIQDMSPTFAGTLFSLSSTIASTAFFILPVTVGYITDKMQTLEQWNKIFFLGIGVVMPTKLIFVCFGSTKIQPWNFVEEETEKKDKTQTKSEERDKVTKF